MCLSHLIYTVRSCLIHTCYAAPMPSPTMPFFSRPRHSTAVETTCSRSTSSGYLAEFHEVVIRCIPISDAVASVKSNTVFKDQEKSGSSTLQKRLSRTSSSDISSYHAVIHEEHVTVGAGQGRGMACVN